MTKQEMIDLVRSLADALSDMAEEASDENKSKYQNDSDYFSAQADAYALSSSLVRDLGDDLGRWSGVLEDELDALILAPEWSDDYYATDDDPEDI